MARNTRTQYVPLGGGLDVVSPALSIPAGRLLTCVNYEPWYNGGYRRIDGFERYDGRPKPSEQSFIGAELSDIGAAMAGDTVTGDTSGATGTIAAISGNWIAITKVTGTFQQEDLNSGTYTIVNQDPTALLAPDNDTEDTFLLAAQDLYRDDIATVTGAGDVLGIWQRESTVYAIRDNAGNTASILFKASASGWTTSGITMADYLFFDTGGGGGARALPAEGDTITGATSGETATVHRIITHGGSVAANDAYGYIVITSPSGAFNVSEDLTVSGTVRCTTTTTNTTFAFTVDGEYQFINHNFYAGSSTYRTYGVNGVDPAFEIDENDIVSPILFPENAITNQPSSNVPFLIEEHRGYLFLAFPGGYFAHSVNGEPMNFNGFLDAAEFGVGSEVTGMNSVVGGVMTIATQRYTMGLFGKSTSDWEIRLVGESTGGRLYTSHRLDTVYGLGDFGITSVARTDAFGDFQGATVSQLVQPMVNTLRDTVTQATIVRSANQYRVYFSDGSFLIMYVPSPGAVSQARGTQTQINVEFGYGLYPAAVKRIFNTEDENGTERSYFATTDGYVYEDRIGYNFDGAEIESYLRTPFTHLGSPSLRKFFRRLDLELSAIKPLDLKFVHDLTYGSGEQASTAVAGYTTANVEQIDVFAGAGFWSVSNWDEFYWDGQNISTARAELNGTGENISFLIYHSSAISAPHIIQGMTIHYDARRLQR